MSKYKKTTTKINYEAINLNFLLNFLTIYSNLINLYQITYAKERLFVWMRDQWFVLIKNNWINNSQDFNNSFLLNQFKIASKIQYSFSSWIKY